MADRTRACCASGQFIVAADESKGELPVEAFEKLSHTKDFSSYGLPNIPEGKELWWNADYILYAARDHLPYHDYYVMIEYDTFVNCDVDRIVAQCAQEGIDFVAHQIQRIYSGSHWSFDTVSQMTIEAWWCLIPFIIISGRAVDVLRRSRRSLAVQWGEGRLESWPYSEAFLPTATAQNRRLRLRSLGALVAAELVRYRPFLSTRDEHLKKEGIIAHPVLSGRRFVEAFMSHEYPGARTMPIGPVRKELQTEDLADLRAVLGTQISVDHDHRGGEHIVFRPWADVARGKSADQSSHSEWSHGRSASEDARLAVTGALPADYAFHTASEDRPWWQVDLLEECSVECVEILTRVGPLGARFRTFRLEGSRDGVEWETLYVKSDDSPVSSEPEPSNRFKLAAPAIVSYLRITQLDSGVMHLRRVRALGFPVSQRSSAIVPAEPATLKEMLADPDNQEAVASKVISIVHQRVFGRRQDSYDIDALAFLAAGIESSQYAVAHMTAAKRFPDAARLQDYAVECTPEEGMVLEFGVFSGNSINRIASRLPTRRIFGFDSFEGLPESWRPGFEQGTFARGDLPKVLSNVELVVGWFNDTLLSFVDAHAGETLALLHVDCDLYSSTKTVFDCLSDRIRAGTIIIFDEYFNYPGWRCHEFQAFQELTAHHGIDYEYIAMVPSHQQVAVRIVSVA